MAEIDDPLGTGSICPAPDARLAIMGATTIFYYDDMQPARAFYSEILGFRMILDREWAVIFAVTDSFQLALVEGLTGSQVPIPGTNKGTMLSLVTGDLVAVHDRMVALGVPLVQPGIRSGCRGRALEFHLRDPGGYTIEFLQWIEPPGAPGDVS